MGRVHDLLSVVPPMMFSPSLNVQGEERTLSMSRR